MGNHLFKFLIIIWPHFETMVLREYQGDRGDWVMLPISYLTFNWKCWCTLSILLFSRVSVRGISVWTYCQSLNLCLCYRTLPPAGAPGASRRSSRGSGRAKEISRLSRLSDQLIEIPSMLSWVWAKKFFLNPWWPVDFWYNSTPFWSLILVCRSNNKKIRIFGLSLVGQ